MELEARERCWHGGEQRGPAGNESKEKSRCKTISFKAMFYVLSRRGRARRGAGATP